MNKIEINQVAELLENTMNEFFIDGNKELLEKFKTLLNNKIDNTDLDEQSKNYLKDKVNSDISLNN